MKMEQILTSSFINKLKKQRKIIAVLLFGSYVRNEPHRDIDICLVLDKTYPSIRMSNKKIEYSAELPFKFDVSVFQQLPLYIRKRILENCKILFCKDEDRLYEIAYETIRDFNLFEKAYNYYLEAIENEV